MIKIDYLDNNLWALEGIANMWYETTKNIWTPPTTPEYAIERFRARINDDTLPLTFVALYEGKAIATCSIDSKEGLYPQFSPWLCALVVAEEHRGSGIGRALIDIAKEKAKSLGHEKLYLGIFKPDLREYYLSLGWSVVCSLDHSDKTMLVMEIGLYS